MLHVVVVKITLLHVVVLVARMFLAVQFVRVYVTPDVDTLFNTPTCTLVRTCTLTHTQDLDDALHVKEIGNGKSYYK